MENDQNGLDRSGPTAAADTREKLSSWLGYSPAEIIPLVEALEPGGEARLMHICLLAEGLFHGDHHAAMRWVRSPAYAFNGKTPLEHARTDQGAKEVETLIGRMEHGIPT